MKRVVLTLLRYYLPGFRSGGPVRTVQNMIEHLGDEFLFRIVTSDRDALDKKPYSGIASGWNKIGTAEVLYLSPVDRNFLSFRRLLASTEYDVLYLNSFFNPDFTIKPLLAAALSIGSDKPIIIAPRGEFSSEALKIKGWKKIPYLRFFKALGLQNKVIWQASSAHEAQDITNATNVGSNRVRIAMDLAPRAAALRESRDPEIGRSSPLKIVFLSRITPMKNLDYVIRVLGKVRGEVEFSIYGPVRDEGYWNLCLSGIEGLPDNVEPKVKGEVAPEQVVGILAENDLFFLPTRGENYGHVIGEALLAGTPVLISDATPWRDLEGAGIGWDLPLSDSDRFGECIERCAAMSSSEYKMWRIRVYEFGLSKLSDPKTLRDNRALFNCF